MTEPDIAMLCDCWGCKPPASPDGTESPCKRVELLEMQKAALLKLIDIEASVVRVTPGDVLLIGAVGYNHGVDVAESLANLREAMGVSAVWLFTGDIDVESVRVAEREHCQVLERQRDEARERLRKVDELVGEHLGCADGCGPLANQIDDVLEEQQQ